MSLGLPKPRGGVIELPTSEARCLKSRIMTSQYLSLTGVHTIKWQPFIVKGERLQLVTSGKSFWIESEEGRLITLPMTLEELYHKQEGKDVKRKGKKRAAGSGEKVSKR